MSLAQVAVTLFLIMDPLGNIPAFIALLKDFSPARQRVIILRELIIALGVILLFNFVGNEILSLISITQATVQLAGGIILFIIALQMIFPKNPNSSGVKHGEEPFIVPLAIPLIAGPSVIGAVMVFAKRLDNVMETSLAIVIAWIATTLILLASSYLKRVLGTRILIACERLMGLIMTILAVNMFTGGIKALFS